MAKTKVTGGYIADGAITSDHLHTTLDLSTKTLTIGATTVSGHLIPDTNITYDLGSSSNRFRDIYLDGTTINLGGTELKKNSDGDIEFKSGSNFKRLVVSELEFDDGTNRKKFKISSGRIKSFDSSGSDDTADKISLSSNTTDDLGEGSSNLYFTTARARGAISASTGIAITDGAISAAAVPNSSLTNSSVTINSNSLSLGGTLTLDTDDIGEGSTNLYYTNARARGAISVSGNALSYNSSTGVLTANYEESPTFTGNVTTTGHYIADTHFRSSDSNATLSATGGGGIYLRPNGYNSTTAQFIVEATTGNVTVAGTVDGRDIAADGTKLDGIESGATADQTQAEINALGITATGLSGTPNITVGTISSGAINATGDITITSTYPKLSFVDTDNNPDISIIGGSGQIAFYDETNSGYVYQYISNQHNFAAKNLTNIGTLSSGAITSSTSSATNLDLILNNTTSGASNRVRIKTTASSQGWDIENDQNLSTFKIRNSTSGRDVFLLNNSAPANALSINGSGATFAGTINSGAITSTGAIEGTSFSDGTISGITFIDEDSFATNSATRVPTQQSIKAYVDAQVAGVVDTAPAALNTLNELAAALGDDANFSTTTSTALGNRLRVDTASQGLTGTQQANAITNLGITATKAELNYVDGVTSNIQTQLNTKITSSDNITGTSGGLSGTPNITVGTIDSGAITSSGNLHVGDDTNISMDASANGQLEIDGNGYQGAIALDGSAMHLYHNSSSRDLVLGTDETARLTIGGTGGFNFHSNNLQSIGTISSGAITSTGVSSFGSGTTVGSVELDGSSIGVDEAGIFFQPNSAYRCVHPVSMTSTPHSSDISLGWSNNKWKDIYLAGSVRADSGYQVATTPVIDSSRNLINIPSLNVNHSSNLSGTQVYIKKQDASTNLQRWGEGTSGSDTYRFRIDQNFRFVGNPGSGGTDVITIDSANGNINTSGTISSGKISTSFSSSHTTSTISHTNAALDLYNPLEANTDEKGTIITFSDNYFDGTNYIKTTRAAIKGGTDTVGNTADGYLAFYTDNGGANSANERLRIDKNGNFDFKTGNFSNIGTINSGDITTTGIQMGTGTSNDIQADGKTAYIGSAIFGNSASTNVPATAVHIKGSGTPALRIEDLDSTNQVYDFISNYGVGLSIVDQTSSITPLAFAHTTGNATFAGTISSGSITVDPSGTYGNGITINAGDNLTGTYGAKQILMTWGGSTSIDYAHSIRTRHNSNADTGNTVEVYLWDYGTDSSTTIGTKRALVLENSTGLDLLTGGYRVGGQTVIDSSRNLTNIGTISSGNITVTETAIFQDGDTDSTLLLGNDSGRGYIRFYRDGATAYGQIIHDGTNFNLSTTAGLVKVLDDLEVTGTISSGAITSSDSITLENGGLILGEDAYSASTAYVGMKSALMTGTNDYMIISAQSTSGDSGHTYVSAKDGQTVHIRGGGNNSSNQIRVPDASYISMDTSSLRFTGALAQGTTTVIDSSRNLTNIGNITLSGTFTPPSNQFFVFNKPSNSGYQTVARFGSAAAGIYITSDSSIITSGAYYNNGWTLTDSTATLLNFDGGSFGFETASGTVGNSASFAQTATINSSGIDSKLNGFLINGTRVIDSSRNLANIGTISTSGNINAGANINVQNNGILDVTTLRVRGDNDTSYSGAGLTGGISLWSTGATTSQIMFKPTSAGSLGNHGFCTDSYNTYFVMDTTNRGWVFRNHSTATNVASISNTGGASFNNGIKINATTIVDSSRNLTNIGTVSCGTITLTNTSHLQLYTTGGDVGTGGIDLPRGGHITFYGNNNVDHSIGSRNSAGNVTDDLRISSYGALYIDLDSNANNSSTADFVIGRHGSGTGTMSTLVTISGENGNYTSSGTINSGAITSSGIIKATEYQPYSSTASIAYKGYNGTALVTGVNGAGYYYGSDGSDYGIVIQGGHPICRSVKIGTVNAGTTVIDSSRNINCVTFTNTGGAKLEVQDSADGGSSRGIYMWNSSDTNWVIYMSTAGAGKAPDGGTACSGLDGRTSHGIRYRVNDSTTQIGHVFENNNDEALFQIQPDTGNIFARGNVTAYASDARLKTNIQTIENPIEKIKKIRGVEFDWLDNIEETHQFKPKCKRETGVIAQEIEEVIPDAISPAPFNNEYKTVEKDKIVALLIEGMKEQQELIEKLTARIEELENK